MSAAYLGGLSDSDRAKIYKISFALRSVSEGALGKRDNSLFPIYSLDDFQKMLQEPEPPVQEKLTLLMKHLGRVTEYPGQANEFDSANDYSVVCAKNAEEANFYFDSLVGQGLATREQSYVGHPTPRFKVTADGWKELNRIEQLGSESSNAFIAMWFHTDRDPFEKAISAAVKAAGYLPVRVDKIEHVNHIDDEIIARIRGSKFLISDFTRQRNGVYFEAGFMLGLGRPVIWLCEKEDLKNVAFDTRQYNTIDYKDAEDLRTRLQFRIEALLGKGPHKEN
jgi:nucleoside 2-deoxyribosyltransferase